MKTLELKLKKDVFIVQPEETGNMNSWISLYSEQWDFICLGSELTEEIASELVETHKNCKRYIDYTIKERNRFFELSIPSFISAVESKGFYWLRNPIKHPKDYEVFPDSLSLFAEQEKLHLEAEEKTFKSPLIFVKK